MTTKSAHLVWPSPLLGVRRPFRRAVSTSRLRAWQLVVAVPAELRLALVVPILPLVIQERLRGATERVVHLLIGCTEAGVGAHHPAAATEAGCPRGALDEPRVHREVTEALREEPRHRRQEASPRAADMALTSLRPMAWEVDAHRPADAKESIMGACCCAGGQGKAALNWLCHSTGMPAEPELALLLSIPFSLLSLFMSIDLGHTHAQQCRSRRERRLAGKYLSKQLASTQLRKGQWTNQRSESLEKMNKLLHWPRAAWAI